MEESRRPRTLVVLVAFLALLTLASIVGFCIPWRPAAASKEGAGIDSTITYLLVVTGIILVLGHVVLFRFLWKSSGAEAAAYGRPSRRAEWLWSLVPVFIMVLVSEAGVLFVSGPVWDSLYAVEPEDPLIVEVVGKQFEWYVRYPGEDGVFGTPNPEFIDEGSNLMGLDDRDEAALDDVVKRDLLVLPAGRPVRIRLRSYDVIHSFFVPAFRVKQDLIPGFPTRVQFTPTEVGEYELACAELCGVNHFQMRGRVQVMEPEAFEAWLAKQFTFGG